MDPALVRLEGLHALKHCLRFGGEVVAARTTDRTAVLALAQDVCPDLVGRLADLLVEVGDLGPRDGARALPSPVVAEAIRPRWSVEDIAPRMDRPVVALERPTHLGNLGAVVRVAAAADAAGVLTTGTADPWHPTAVRGAAGLQFALPVLTVDSLPALEGRPLIAVDPDGDPDLAVPAGAVLVFGSEREGLTSTTLDAADGVLALPMRPGVSSLNLATSVAATLYRLTPGGLPEG